MMAVTASVADMLKHLECSICLEVFENPKELVCRHLFCKCCLDQILKFNKDGSGVIDCPHRCTDNTVIGATQTTNDLVTGFYVKCMIDEWKVKHKRLDNVLETSCSTSNCENAISILCLVCRQFMCKTCDRKHDDSHAKATIVVNKDKSLKVLCETHNTMCEFMCCENEVTCIYCVNRNHSNHHFKDLQCQVKKIKEILDVEIQKIHSFPQICTAAKESVSTSEKRFEQAIKYRKLKCLSSYISLLNDEEELIREKFNNLTSHHAREFNICQSADPLKEIFKWTDVEIGLLKKNILDRVIQLRCSGMLPCRTTSLSENNFMCEHPLGELVVAVEEVAVDDLKDTPSFKFNVPENHEDELSSVLLQKLKDLLLEAELNQLEVDTNIGCETMARGYKGTAVSKQPATRSPKFTLRNLRRAVAHTPSADIFKKQAEVQKNECVRSLEKDGFEYIEKLITEDCEPTLTLLLSERCDVVKMRGGRCGGTALHVAAEQNKLNIMKLLLKNGSCVNDKDIYGNTVLHFASMHGSFECLSWLCKQYSHLLNVESEYGNTALHLAVISNRLNSVTELCMHEVDINIKDNHGNTAIDYAKRSKSIECLEEIQRRLRERGEVDEGKFNDCQTVKQYQQLYENQDDEDQSVNEGCTHN